MTVLQAIVLGAVQGLSEFLPISSSGHLVLVEKLFGIASGSLTLEVLMHLGTLIAVFAVYWRELIGMIEHPLRSDLKLLVVATIPAVIARLLYTDIFVKLSGGAAIFVSIRDGLSGFFDTAFAGGFLGWSFIITSAILWLGEAVARAHVHTHKHVRFTDALVMGLMQAVAILPGVSRSGSTISGGRSMGLARSRAADFAFLMSVPAILGGLVTEGKDILTGEVAETVSALPLVAGVLTAAVFGFLAIKLMLVAVRKLSLNWFAIYTLALGVLVLVDTYATHRFF